jgi:hypothetical protein
MIARNPARINLNEIRRTFLAGTRIIIPFKSNRKTRKLTHPYRTEGRLLINPFKHLFNENSITADHSLGYSSLLSHQC